MYGRTLPSGPVIMNPDLFSLQALFRTVKSGDSRLRELSQLPPLCGELSPQEGALPGAQQSHTNPELYKDEHKKPQMRKSYTFGALRSFQPPGSELGSSLSSAFMLSFLLFSATFSLPSYITHKTPEFLCIRCL